MPELAGEWTLTVFMYSGVSCDGSLALTGAEEPAGAFTVGPECPPSIAGTMEAGIIEWDKSRDRGSFTGLLYRDGTTASFVNKGVWQESTIAFDLDNYYNGTSHVASVTGRR